MRKYPNLVKTVTYLGRDNGNPIRARFNWSRIKDFDLNRLEKAAKSLTDEELETLVAGEMTEADEIAARVPELSDFVDMCFDGEYTSVFYEDFSSMDAYLAAMKKMNW